MMKITRRLVRQTAATDRGRPLVVELHPGFVIFRLKRTRHRYSADCTLYTGLLNGPKPNASSLSGKVKSRTEGACAAESPLWHYGVERRG